MAFRSIEFSSTIPDVTISATGQERVRIVVQIDGSTVFEEWFYTLNGVVTLEDLPELVTPYARQQQHISLVLQCYNTEGTAFYTDSTTVIYCAADLGDIVPSDYLAANFLTLLFGVKVTAMGRLEILSMYGSDTPACLAYYSDGSSATFELTLLQHSGQLKTYDVSPGNFTVTGTTLVRYRVTAGSRIQKYEIDLNAPDCAPVLVFLNSFGVDEMAYCTGTHTVDPSYNRSVAYVNRAKKNYHIDEQRTFKADTGVLNIAMANWWDEVFRSQSVRIVNFYSGVPNVGKDLLITDSKSSYSNDDADLPRFTFSYQYAQRNHNVVQTLRAGRIFDNTFDYTFN